MKAAIGSPVNLLERYASVSTLQIALAQLWYLPGYLEYFRQRKACGDTIILDNGAYELGEPLYAETLADICRELKPDIMVAPDVLGDAYQTLLAISDFLERFGPRIDCALMAVPQGSSERDWMLCLREIVGMQVFDWFAVPKVTVPMFGGSRRGQCLTIRDLKGDANIHLLGLYGDPLKEVLEVADIAHVKSIDSFLPLRLGLQGRPLYQSYPKPPSIDRVFARDRYPERTMKIVRGFVDLCETGRLPC